ncbi:D-2-hydroxyacid dehydrogenase [Halorubrum sp. JWXQ-INN 858]|uniref:D-2-hydroxyacid dehydrogenase n=1 Tax=Halorubrum sp. JWXQ-INN 858 TaxID=2690782 RepID=UPI00135C4D5A|nr:D-2-hydroxyacid dehydrogenase [Halorubrum sp. JWXQ-INN 858]MWV63828.1 D-2-hydroxyacid dehydrogenase [Halorubrum sp. JWXQ-INN 858]
MTFTLGVHDTVDAVFPPEVLVDALANTPAASGTDVRVVPAGDTDALAACDALVTFAYDGAFLDAGLEWIHSIQTGVDRFPFDDLEGAGIALTNSTGIHGDAIGDTVAGYMLSFARRLHVYRDQQRDREWTWPAFDEPFSLAGERLCVVGLGVLGRGIASRASGLGMDVVGVRRTPTPVANVDETVGRDGLADAIADARFVALALPLTSETAGLIGEAELASMREDAYLINVARGRIVDEDALVAALDEGSIAGAALDTFETEPLPEASPLWGHEEVIVTPHAAAAHGEYADRVAEIVAESLRRRAAGEGYANRVV